MRARRKPGCRRRHLVKVGVLQSLLRRRPGVHQPRAPRRSARADARARGRAAPSHRSRSVAPAASAALATAGLYVSTETVAPELMRHALEQRDGALDLLLGGATAGARCGRTRRRRRGSPPPPRSAGPPARGAAPGCVAPVIAEGVRLGVHDAISHGGRRAQARRPARSTKPRGAHAAGTSRARAFSEVALVIPSASASCANRSISTRDALRVPAELDRENSGDPRTGSGRAAALEVRRARARRAAPAACGATAHRRCREPAHDEPRSPPRPGCPGSRARSAVNRRLGREVEHLVRGVPVAGRERLVGALGNAGDPLRSAASIAWPSGISCVRHGASRASRSTRRSTVILAIRRHVVSLPPVIVIIPRRSLQLRLARDVDRLLGVAAEISGRTPA